jgi:glycosyltransferase involved in cell wall biosynthesis
MKVSIYRVSTVYMSTSILLKGQLSFLSSKFNITAIFSGSKNEHEYIRSGEGVDTINVNFKRRISILNDFASLIHLFIIFKQKKPFVVHSITPKAGLLSMLAAKLAGVPIRIHTFTGLIFPYKKGFLQKILIFTDKLLCWASTNVYPEGIGVMNDLIKFNITKKPLFVIANGNINGINTDFFKYDSLSKGDLLELRSELGLSINDFVFIYVGRIVRDKGIIELVKAFESILNLCGSNCKLLLVGSYKNESDLIDTSTLSLIRNNPCIITTGFSPNVKQYYAVSDCLVFPSYREGFPNVVLEAGAMGLPSIVTDISGCNEIILEGVNGTIVPPKDIESLTKAMLKIKNDLAWRAYLKSNSRELIKSRYEQTLVWNSLLEEYNRLVLEEKNRRQEKNV